MKIIVIGKRGCGKSSAIAQIKSALAAANFLTDAHGAPVVLEERQDEAQAREDFRRLAYLSAISFGLADAEAAEKAQIAVERFFPEAK